MRRGLTILFAGALFGTGLAVSGMTNPNRVIGFLDVAGDWDPTLAFVMAGALAVFSIGMMALKKRGRGFFGCSLPDCAPGPISRPLIWGSAIFGIGWGLSGFCPGPALANLGGLRTEALVFVPAMALGMWLVQRFFGVDR